MKWTFKYRYVEKEVMPSLSDVMREIYCAAASGSRPNVSEEPKIIKICSGGGFVPDVDGSEIQFTPFYLLQKTFYELEYVNQMSDYFPRTVCPKKNPDGKGEQAWAGYHNPAEAGIFGYWSDDIDQNAAKYYYVDNGFIHKILIVEWATTSLSGIIDYLILMEHNGKLMYMVPEEGDVIYDTYEEAENAIKNG